MANTPVTHLTYSLILPNGDKPSVNITEDTPQVFRVLSALSLRKKHNCHRWERKVFSCCFNFYTDIPRRRFPLPSLSQCLTEYTASAKFSFKFSIPPLKVQRAPFHSANIATSCSKLVIYLLYFLSSPSKGKTKGSLSFSEV